MRADGRRRKREREREGDVAVREMRERLIKCMKSSNRDFNDRIDVSDKGLKYFR